MLGFDSAAQSQSQAKSVSSQEQQCHDVIANCDGAIASELAKRAKAYEELGEFQRAVADYRSIIAMESNDKSAGVVIAAETARAAVDELVKVLSRSSGDLGEYLSGLVQDDRLTQLRQQFDGKPAKQIELLNELIACCPENPSAHYQRADAYKRLEQWKQAADDYSEYFRLSVQTAQGLHIAFAHLYRGYVYEKVGQWEKAVDDYKTAPTLDPDDSAVAMTSLTRLAKIYQDSGDYHKAEAEWTEYIRLYPKIWSGYARRAALYELLGQPKKGANDCNEVLKLSAKEPSASSLYWSRARTACSHKQYRRAIRDFNKALDDWNSANRVNDLFRQ